MASHYLPMYRALMRSFSIVLPIALLLIVGDIAGAKPARSGNSKPGSARVKATAYHGPCRTCGTGRRTATGRSASSRGVAADPRVFPMGTVLYIPGYGNARVDDTGGAIRGRKIDVRFSSHAATRHWGNRAVNVRVVSRPGRR